MPGDRLDVDVHRCDGVHRLLKLHHRRLECRLLLLRILNHGTLISFTARLPRCCGLALCRNTPRRIVRHMLHPTATRFSAAASCATHPPVRPSSRRTRRSYSVPVGLRRPSWHHHRGQPGGEFRFDLRHPWPWFSSLGCGRPVRPRAWLGNVPPWWVARGPRARP